MNELTPKKLCMDTLLYSRRGNACIRFHGFRNKADLKNVKPTNNEANM